VVSAFTFSFCLQAKQCRNILWVWCRYWQMLGGLSVNWCSSSQYGSCFKIWQTGKIHS